MKSIAFMRELVSKGMSWEDAAEIAERFEDSVEARIAEAMAPQRSAAAERQAVYRERKRNAEHNAEHNAVTDTVTDSVDNDPPSPPLSPQTPQTPPHPPECDSTHTREAVGFDEFWAAYPRKTDKAAARKAFDRAAKRADLQTMLAAIERQREWEQWRRGIVPHAATWLNRDRWTDADPNPVIPFRAADANSPRSDDKLARREANNARAFAGAAAAAGQRWKP